MLAQDLVLLVQKVLGVDNLKHQHVHLAPLALTGQLLAHPTKRHARTVQQAPTQALVQHFVLYVDKELIQNLQHYHVHLVPLELPHQLQALALLQHVSAVYLESFRPIQVHHLVALVQLEVIRPFQVQYHVIFVHLELHLQPQAKMILPHVSTVYRELTHKIQDQHLVLLAPRELLLQQQAQMIL